MPWGAIVNALAVISGGAAGLLIKKKLPERLSSAAMTAIGLCTLYIGISQAMQGKNTVVLILSAVLGAAVGTAADLDGKIEKLGAALEKRLGGKDEKGSFSRGFVTACLLFCVGAMTAVGVLNAGLRGDNGLLYTKSVLDLISSCVLAGTLGAGVLFSSVFVLILEGGLTLLAGLLREVLTDSALLAEIGCAGAIAVIALGLNILGITKIKAANLLPALLFVPLFYFLAKLGPA